MPRIARVVAVGVPHHVTQRGNHRARTFFSDADRELYLELLTEYCQLHHVELLGYCLMSNHVHLIAVPHRSDSLARGIGRAHNAFSRWMNIGRHQTGHFFQARFDSTPMDSTHYPASLGLHGTELDWGGRPLGSRFATDKAYLGVLDGVRKQLGRNIDFARQSDREAIGYALIQHIRKTGECDVAGENLKGCK